MTLVEEIYTLSKGFPSEERFGLTSQVRRAAVSMASNIGEGARRKWRKAFLHHLDIALGSQGEVDIQLELATRLQRFSHPSRATCTAGQAAVGWRSIGRSPTAISLKNNGGGHRRGRPCLVGRAMALSD